MSETLDLNTLYSFRINEKQMLTNDDDENSSFQNFGIFDEYNDRISDSRSFPLETFSIF